MSKMEDFIRNHFDSPCTQLIGNSSQSLQIVLPQYYSFIIKSENLVYFSNNIESNVISDQVFLTVKQSHIEKYLVSTYLTKLYNKSNNLAYVGINMEKGRLFVNIRKDYSNKTDSLQESIC